MAIRAHYFALFDLFEQGRLLAVTDESGDMSDFNPSNMVKVHANRGVSVPTIFTRHVLCGDNKCSQLKIDSLIPSSIGLNVSLILDSMCFRNAAFTSGLEPIAFRIKLPQREISFTASALFHYIRTPEAH
jgi:hypothetical protein